MKIIDNDAGEIAATEQGKEVHGWSYKDNAERRIKMMTMPPPEVLKYFPPETRAHLIETYTTAEVNDAFIARVVRIETLARQLATECREFAAVCKAMSQRSDQWWLICERVYQRSFATVVFASSMAEACADFVRRRTRGSAD